MYNLSKFIPSKSYLKICQWIQELDITIKLSKPRKTKIGDFKVVNGNFIISINNDLNQYSFLITLVHELAHAYVYKDYKNNVQPHGLEWKQIFKDMLLNFITPDYFPEDILEVLSLYVINPKASTFSDYKLVSALRKYDKKKHKILSELESGSVFHVLSNSKKIFIKGVRIRKRFECVEKKTNRKYLFHPFIEVIFVQNKLDE